jgi:hypothetical protein
MLRYQHVGGAIFLLLGATCLNDVGTVEAAEANPQAVSSLWDAVNGVKAPDPASPATTLDDWGEVVMDCLEAFEKQITSIPNEARAKAVEHYVAQFGRHGPVADYRWICGRLFILLPNASAQPEWGSGRAKWVPPVRELFCESIVRRFLADRVFRQRYYHPVMWSQRYFFCPDRQEPQLEGLIGLTRAVMQKSDQQQYWWWCRSAVILCYAVGREDLLEDVEAEDMLGVIRELERWFSVSFYFLAADQEQYRWRTRCAGFSCPPPHPLFPYFGQIIVCVTELFVRERGSYGMFPTIEIPRDPVPDWPEEGIAPTWLVTYHLSY